MWNWIKSIWSDVAMHDNFTGLLLDPRPTFLREADFIHEERVMGPVEGVFKNPQILNSGYPYKNQKRTSSCVPHGVGLALSIERKTDTGNYASLSEMFAYRLRSNYPQEGCFPQNIFEVYKKRGAPLYDSLPTPEFEEQANAVILTNQMSAEAEIYKGNEYWTLKYPNEIQTIAEVAQQGHAVAITIFATGDEWGREFPIISVPNLTYGQAEIRHEVCVLPKSSFTLNGKKYITVQDSAWFGGKKLRHLSEDFIKLRNRTAIYWDTVANLGSGAKPKYTFTKVLTVGSQGPEVVQMQKLLISEGLLPSDLATGLFAGRTLAGVRAFQNKYADEILKPLGLDKPTNTWGSMCIAKANKLCA